MREIRWTVTNVLGRGVRVLYAMSVMGPGLYRMYRAGELSFDQRDYKKAECILGEQIKESMYLKILSLHELAEEAETEVCDEDVK